MMMELDSPPPAPPPTECELLGGFSLLTQATLAIICIGVLLFKRARERPQRPWIVWLFDVSKQAFSSTLQHAVNVVIGLLLGRDSQASACSWYFVMYVLTSINALWLVALMMWAIERLIERRGCRSLTSGRRDEKPRELHPTKCGSTSCRSCSARTPTVRAWCEDSAGTRTR